MIPLCPITTVSRKEFLYSFEATYAVEQYKDKLLDESLAFQR